MLASMGVSVSMLASGSRGNCGLVASSSTKILVDAGISCRETFKRMKSLERRSPLAFRDTYHARALRPHLRAGTLAKKLTSRSS